MKNFHMPEADTVVASAAATIVSRFAVIRGSRFAPALRSRFAMSSTGPSAARTARLVSTVECEL